MAEAYVINKKTLDDIAGQSMVLAGKTNPVSTAEIKEDLTAANTEVSSQANLISQIKTALEGKAAGGGAPVEVKEKEICFWDYDGTLRYSYSLDEIQELTELPPGPEHEGLVFQSWNWSLEKIKAQGRRTHIGALYVTDDGNTRLYISIKHEQTLIVPLYLYKYTEDALLVDWGDKSDVETVSTFRATELSHTYSQTGDYVISLKLTGGTVQLGDGTNRIFGGNTQHWALLKKLEFGTGCVGFGKSCLQGQAHLETIATSAEFKNSGQDTLHDCFSLRCIVTSPDSSTLGGGYNVYGCGSLKTVCLSEVQGGIGNSAFRECVALKNISWPKDADGTTNNNAFYDCRALMHFELPDNVPTIHSSAFRNCYSLTEFVVRAGVTNIGNSVFYGCNRLCKIRFLPTTPPTVENANTFTGVPTSCIIEVPAGCLEAYTTATNYPSADTYTYVEVDV